MEELEDEGVSYFLELDDGAVLFLSGQYLDEDESPFPCTEFIVRRLPADGDAWPAVGAYAARDRVGDGHLVLPLMR